MYQLKLSLLRLLDRLFPPEPLAKMDHGESMERELRKAAGSMGEYLRELARTDIDVLDYGCGWGGESLWLAERVRSVVGYDVDPSSIAQAEGARAAARTANCRFVATPDGAIPIPDGSIDAVFSTDTFEHVMDLPRAFAELARVLRPGGLVVTRFGPLFHSPFGYHLRWACQVPWAHLLFGLGPVVQLRNERAGTVLDARSWQDTGLNGSRFAEFRTALLGAGFEVVRFERIPVKRLTWLAHVPRIGDWFTFGVDCVAKKPTR